VSSSLTDGLPGDRPNIVVIMTDDMRQDELAWMPNVRHLIEDRGVSFVNSFSPYSLCCPARASFVTGQYTHNHGVWSNTDRFGFSALDDSSTLATDLSAAGYQTAFLGKYLNGYGTMPVPDGSGDDPARYVPPGWLDWRGSVSSIFGEGTPEAGGTYSYFDTTLNVDGALQGNQGAYQTRLFGRHSADMLEELARSPKPFFLWASYVAPHVGGPVEKDDPAPVVRSDGSRMKVTTPARPRDVRGLFDQQITEPFGAVAERDMSDKPSYLRRNPTLNDAEREALTAVSRQRAEALHVVDQEVAHTVDVLERTGELDDTLLVFASDNGYLMGEHGVFKGKRLPYDSSLRVPTLMAGPGIPEGEVRHDPFMTIDFAPTFLDLAGGRTDRVMDGVSMLDVARTGDQGWNRAVFTETGPMPLPKRRHLVREELPDGPSSLRFSQGVRTPGYLYAENASKERELYDLRADPAELTNIVDRPRMARVAARLAEVLDQMRACRGRTCDLPLPRSLQGD
jgi:arylsulfatase A-like enzyme